ncbi:MAG: M14 family metallopeptidase [Bacteroidales bacterium]|nr:M14 family metallopeptidase [Bacteroidales bacterium]
MIRRVLITAVSVLVSFQYLLSQPAFLTVAESSDFKSTSNYNDVMSFIEKLKSSSKFLRVETIAQTAEGRDVPLLIIGKPLPKSPAQLVNDERVIVYIQANIHAGEVEGKEASLMFARDLLAEKDPELLKHIILLICPNFNPDGNEKISPGNRSYQNGPVNGVGVRYNGQMLDLNRDGMKAESPEVRGLINRVFNAWDPDIFMDCHTTDGSFHIEPVTFTWMVNPCGDNSLIKFMRSKMMPEMSATLLNKYKVENCYYGEFNNMMNPESGWFYDAADPRYLVNYYGLRNRLAILNENYVYADYKSRVWGCYYLIKSLADYASVHKAEIINMLLEADKKSIARGMNPSAADSFAIEFKVRPLDENVTIKTYEAERTNEPDVYPPFRRTDRRKDVTVPYYIDYYASRNVKFPYAYLITNNDPEVISLLKSHGIIVEKLTGDMKTKAERFDIAEVKGSGRLNQGHYTNTIKGRFINATVDFPAGILVIRSGQPLANLAAYLLEPQSNDGLMTWNYFDRYLVPQWGIGYNPYPVYKIIEPIEIKSVLF